MSTPVKTQNVISMSLANYEKSKRNGLKIAHMAAEYAPIEFRHVVFNFFQDDSYGNKQKEVSEDSNRECSGDK